MEKLHLVSDWDKTFAKSEKIEHKKVTFHNRYGITLAADMYKPKSAEGKLAAIAVSGPFWCSQGTVFRTLCTDYGRERIFNNRF